MTDHRELLKQALEALGLLCTTCFDERAHHQVMSNPDHFMNQVMASIRAALAEPEQDGNCQHCGGKGCSACDARQQKEPYCYAYEYASYFGLHREFSPVLYNGSKPNRAVPLYTAPPRREWQSLTDEEIEAANELRLTRLQFARAIEQALKEKNGG